MQVVIATKAFYPVSDGAEQPRPVAQAPVRCDRRFAAAAGRRLRRPLSDPPLRSRDADRGDAVERCTTSSRRQGALHRRLEHVRVAVHEDARHLRRARLDALRVDAESLQPGLPRGRARDAAALPRGRHRRDPVESAGARISRRQPPRRATAARRCARRPTSSRTSMYYAEGDFTIADRAAAHRRAARRQADADRAGVAARASRASPRRSSALRSWRTSTKPSPRSACSSSPRRSRFLEEPYQPHRILGHA